MLIRVNHRCQVTQTGVTCKGTVVAMANTEATQGTQSLDRIPGEDFYQLIEDHHREDWKKDYAESRNAVFNK